MILFCHFLEKYTVEIPNESIDYDGFDVEIYRDGFEDEYFVQFQMPSGETKKSLGFDDEQIALFKSKLLPCHDVIRELIEYWFDGGRNEHYSLSLRAKLIDPNIRLLELISPFNRAELESDRYYFIHCNLHDMYYDEMSLYRYTGFEFVTDDGKVLNYSHVLDMELREWAHVSIAKFSTDPKFERLHGFIEMMYIYLDEFPEHKIRTDADGNVTLSVRGAQLTVPFNEINDSKFEYADEGKSWSGSIMRRLIANTVRIETPPPSTHHIIRIDEFKLREVLTNVHRPRKLLLDTICHTDRQNVYRVQLVCAPVDDDHAYVFLKDEISSVEEPWEIKLSVPFIEPDEMSAITYPITTQWRMANFYPSDAEELPIDRFEKYFDRAKGSVEDFLVNFAGLDRGVLIERR